jgi:hypothetical protein
MESAIHGQSFSHAEWGFEPPGNKKRDDQPETNWFEDDG